MIFFFFSNRQFVNGPNCKFIILSIYGIHDENITNYINSLVSVLNNEFFKAKRIFLMGNFNINFFDE